MPPISSKFAVGVAALVVAGAAGALPPPDLVLPPARETPAESEAPVAFRPGLWEIRHEASGGRAAREPQVQTQCFDAKALETDPHAPLKLAPRATGGRRGGPNCRFGVVQVAGGQFAMPGSCQGPMGSASVDWAGTHAAESFDMAGRMRMGPMTMEMRVNGRRIGECSAP
ncbi:MAG: DUF3617 domain-containing protein [Silanimonas sp.]